MRPPDVHHARMRIPLLDRRRQSPNIFRHLIILHSFRTTGLECFDREVGREGFVHIRDATRFLFRRWRLRRLNKRGSTAGPDGLPSSSALGRALRRKTPTRSAIRTSSAIVAICSFSMMLLRWALIVRSVAPSSRAISLFILPRATRSKTCRSEASGCPRAFAANGAVRFSPAMRSSGRSPARWRRSTRPW